MFSLKMTHLLRSRPQKSPPTTDIKGISRSILVDGVERVLSYDGTGQYNRDGTGASACGLAALNFARVVFSMEQGGLQNTDLLEAVLSRECAEQTTAICVSWSGDVHLDVEDICRDPLFEKTLKLEMITYGLPGVSGFKSLLTELSNLDSSAVAIITRPLEIIACLKLRLTPRNVFIIFDSHPRPSYPNGAGMIVNTSIEGTARRLTELLPTVDLPDSYLQWQAELPSNFSGHVFVPHGVETSTPTLWKVVLESSLSMHAENSELRSHNEFLKNEQQRLKSEIKEAEAQSQQQLEETLIQQQQQFRSFSSPPKYLDRPSAPPRHFSPPTRHPPRPSSSKASTSAFNPFGPDSPSATKSSSGRALGYPGSPPTPPSDLDDSIFYAMRLQHEFDNEDRALSAQRAQLAKSTQRLFECGICLEEMPDDSIARPDPCGHTFCRECLRGHVSSRLNEHRFPVLCPTCTADKCKGKGTAGEVSQSLALSLGLTDEQYSIWTEMEMVAFSILLYCRNGRCSWPETNTKKLTSSPVRFRTAPMHGASSVSSRSTLMVQSTRAMALRN
ncbi:hypothetical protein DFH94DRAFT_698777 [Russula ochroleuca]|uniref:RING-type domain-containing protein n=1 Tax=Russula ochroleuca TaxID=152965 RepID=A0A9P5JVL9_9AGAM|nr:hypothetical protein DFH94DRAFT_698777 [Russula ochroleuca]